MMIAETASEWFVASRDGDMNASERRAFAAWLQESPVHVAEYLAIAKLWSDAGTDEATATLAQLLSGKRLTIRAENIVRLPIWPSASNEIRPGLVSQVIGFCKGIGIWRKASAAAVLLLVLALGSGLLSSTAPVDVYSTARGQQQTIFMEDGSVIDLNTNSEISTDFQADQRLVRLSRGEAYFSVAPDPSRPFVVLTDKAVIRVTGTRFNIHLAEAVTNVTVIEGKVEVIAADDIEAGNSDIAAANSTTVMLELSAGNQVLVEENHRMTRRAVDQLSAVTAWKEKRIVFNNKPLKEIIAEFSRYNDINYEIMDDRTAARRFSGVFNSDDPGSFLSYLQQLPGIQVSRYGNSALIQNSTE